MYKTMGFCGQFSSQLCNKYSWTINLQSPDAQLSCSRFAVCGGDLLFITTAKARAKGRT